LPCRKQESNLGQGRTKNHHWSKELFDYDDELDEQKAASKLIVNNDTSRTRDKIAVATTVFMSEEGMMKEETLCVTGER